MGPLIIIIFNNKNINYDPKAIEVLLDSLKIEP